MKKLILLLLLVCTCATLSWAFIITINHRSRHGYALATLRPRESCTGTYQYLRISQEQLQRLSGLVEQILSMGMERRKTFRLHPEEINLKELITPLMEQHQLKADKPLQLLLTDA